MTVSLDRFIKAQEGSYRTALNEIKQGRKVTHWMWFIFPQIAGLGFSQFAQLYAIKDLKEAEAYLNHPILRERLIEIAKALLAHNNLSANEIFGSPDDIKLKSSMTLFASANNTDAVFEHVLTKFFNGEMDEKTIFFIK